MFHHIKKTIEKDFGKKTIHLEKLWTTVMSTFLVFLVLTFGFFFWYFLETGKKLDAPPVLEEDTTQQKLNAIEKRISGVESTVTRRVR